MAFVREPAPKWHAEVPGARWFKGDLHVHTLDDLPGGRAKRPPGFAGDPKDPTVLSAYARAFLQGVVKAGVHVLGLTPHAVRLGEGHETSAVWAIVEAWNSGVDDDKVPFREKIYAVFPGFEPCLKEGREGLHLLFLFDPEIGRESFLKLFDVAMGGVRPWPNAELAMSNLTCEDAFSAIREFRERECPAREDGRGWPIIRKRMQEFSGHEPTLHEDRNGKFVRVSIPLAGV